MPEEYLDPDDQNKERQYENAREDEARIKYKKFLSDLKAERKAKRETIYAFWKNIMESAGRAECRCYYHKLWTDSVTKRIPSGQFYFHVPKSYNGLNHNWCQICLRHLVKDLGRLNLGRMKK